MVEYLSEELDGSPLWKRWAAGRFTTPAAAAFCWRSGLAGGVVSVMELQFTLTPAVMESVTSCVTRRSEDTCGRTLSKNIPSFTSSQELVLLHVPLHVLLHDLLHVLLYILLDYCAVRRMVAEPR